jgi:hypothetical protein
MQATIQNLNKPDSERGISILARSLVKEMREQGYSPDQIITLSSELIHHVSSEMRADIEAAAE